MKINIPRKATSLDLKEMLYSIYLEKDKEGLWHIIKGFFGIEIPRVSVCAEHNAPFDFISDIFFQNVKNVIAVANRQGGKTSNFAVLDALTWFLWDLCEVATVGAIEQQAQKCYSYFQDFITKKGAFKENLVDSLISKTIGKNGSLVQILTGTMAGVNSPHPQKAFLDEVELMQWNILQEAFSMAQSKGDIQGQTIITSSRKFAFGPMERLLNESKDRGFKVYRWCVRETIVPHQEIEVKNTDLYEDLQKYYVNGKFPSDGYLSVEDVISAKRSLDADTWISQWLCERPMMVALVYPQFKDRHIKPQTPDIRSELLISEDPGFAQGHANVVGFWQVTPAGKAKLIDELWVEGKTDDQIIDLVEDKIIELGFIDHKYVDKPRTDPDLKRLLNIAVAAWYFPFNEPAGMALRQRRGYTIVTQNDAQLTKIVNGIPIVRKALEEDMFEIDPKCAGTIGEMKVYHNKKRADGTILDEPAKEVDNGPDMVRYFFINHFPAISSGHMDEIETKDKDEGMATAGVMDTVF